MLWGCKNSKSGFGLGRSATHLGIQEHTDQDDYKADHDGDAGVLLQEQGNPNGAQNHFPQRDNGGLLSGDLLYAHVIEAITAANLDHAQNDHHDPVAGGHNADGGHIGGESNAHQDTGKNIGHGGHADDVGACSLLGTDGHQSEEDTFHQGDHIAGATGGISAGKHEEDHTGKNYGPF